MGVIEFNRKPAPHNMRCSACGVQQEAGCECGVTYVPVKPSVAARQAIARSPGKSDRSIAREAGVSDQTVRRARSTNVERGNREDSRGRMQPATKPRRRPPEATNAEVNSVGREPMAFFQQFEPRFRKFVEANPDMPDGAKVSLSNSLRVCAEGLMELAALIGD